MSVARERKHSAEEQNSSVQGIFTLIYLVMYESYFTILQLASISQIITEFYVLVAIA